MDEINEVCKECGISILQKIKLRAAVEALQPKQDLPPVLFFFHIECIGDNVLIYCDLYRQ